MSARAPGLLYGSRQLPTLTDFAGGGGVDQERIITELRSRARQGARIYRSACLVLVSLIIALYLLPLSSYLVGTHSAEDHLTRFHGLQGARSSLPWYLLLALVQAGLLGLMGWELAHLIPLPRLCPTRAVYGTAPVAVARHLARASASCGLALAPRVQYAGALAGAAAVPPILSLVKGNDGGGGGALWWALGTFAAGVAAWSEMSIASEERELTGLSAARYTYTTL